MPVESRFTGSAAETSGATDQLNANKALVRRFLTEAVTSDDVLLYTALLATDHVQAGPAPYQEFAGIDGSLGYFAGLLTAFPDLEVRVTGAMAIGDQVVAYGTMRGHHDGDLGLGDATFAPTGREASWKYSIACVVEGGKIASTRVGMNRAGLMRQLGIGFSD